MSLARRLAFLLAPAVAALLGGCGGVDGPLFSTDTADGGTAADGGTRSTVGGNEAGAGADAAGADGAGDPGDAASACRAGEKVCAARCVPVDDPVFGCSGTSCAPCTPGDVCSAGSCSHTCGAGLTACPSCVDLKTDPNHCGDCSVVCPAPTGGVASCAGFQCGVTCSPGSHVCGGACVSDGSVATCGSSCTACPTPANATATCNGTSCDFVCNAGYQRSAGGCVSITGCPSTGGTLVGGTWEVTRNDFYGTDAKFQFASDGTFIGGSRAAILPSGAIYSGLWSVNGSNVLTVSSTQGLQCNTFDTTLQLTFDASCATVTMVVLTDGCTGARKYFEGTTVLTKL